MTRGDILNVLSTGYIGTTDPNGVGIALSLGTAPTKININGEVSGNKAGIHFSGPATSSLLVTLGTQGSLTGNNGPAIDAAGTNTDRLVQIVNHGLIYTAGSDIAIRFGNCDMKISNYGTIASDAVGTAILATGVFGYVGTATVLNRGVIQRAVRLYPGVNFTATLENFGTINGIVQVGNSSTTTPSIYQQGTIHGHLIVTSQFGGNLLADLSLGTVTGSVIITAGASATANFSGGSFGGTVNLVGDYAWSLKFAGATFLGGLSLSSSNLGIDLTDVTIHRAFTIADGDSTISFQAGSINGTFLAGSGSTQLDMAGGHVSGLIDLGAGSDTLIGSDGAERILNGPGNDDYDLGAGNDTLLVGLGGAFNDTFDGGLGRDTISLARLTSGMQIAGDYVNLAEGLLHDIPGSLQVLFGSDEISGFENVSGTALNDQIYGDAQANLLSGLSGDDFLFGDIGADTLRGGAGNDTLIGGTGRDVLHGGAGAAVFQFTTTTDTGAFRSTRDVVTDFQAGIDHISVVGLDANATLAGKQSFTFAGNVATSGAGTVRFGYDHGDTVLQFNLDASNTAEFTILLRGVMTPTLSDFFFV